MTDQHPRPGKDDALRLSERESRFHLELIGACSRILTGVMDEYRPAVDAVGETCVPDFCDLCAVELVGEDGLVEVVTYHVARASGLGAPDEWTPIGRECGVGTEATLSYGPGGEPAAVAIVREGLGAQSLVVAPILAGGLVMGWLVMATGPTRRGFRSSALRVIGDLSSRLGTAMMGVRLHREVATAERRQERTARRLRRLAAAAANLAGAETTDDVLRVACIESCIIEDADAAAARWTVGDGESVSAVVGAVAPDMVEEALTAAAGRRVSRGRGWISFPLAGTDERTRAALAVFSKKTLSADQEVVLESLTSFIPVAFERARSATAAIQQEARTRAVLDRSPVALLGMEPTGSVVWANTVAQGILGVASGPNALRSALREIAAAARQSRSVEHHEMLDAGLDLSISAAPMPDLPGQEGWVVAAVTDMTERRAVERALLQAQRLEAMGQVAGGIAHDFNNLLTVISGYAEVISRTSTDRRILPLVGNIDKAANRAAALTQQLLGFTRPRLGSGVVIELREAVEVLRPVLDRLTGPSVSLRIDPPDCALKILGDPAEVEQAVLNLAINACDAMEGEGALGITVEAIDLDDDGAEELGLPAGRYLQLSVSDTGPGMSAEVRTRCLEPFFTTKDRGRGTGLGLWTVYAMASDRGGTLRIDSAPGSGTTVSLVLPRCETADPAPPPNDAPAAWVPGRTVGGVVLLVEDDDEVRELAERALRSTGMDVIGASQAEEALALARTHPFDVLVTDIVLPGMSGVELAGELRGARPDLAVLFVSGYADRETRRHGLGEGARLLRKPYGLDDLSAQVADLIEASGGPAPPT